jgi:hypothetical protein
VAVGTIAEDSGVEVPGSREQNISRSASPCKCSKESTVRSVSEPLTDITPEDPEQIRANWQVATTEAVVVSQWAGT